jgi:hypothetical protein
VESTHRDAEDPDRDPVPGHEESGAARAEAAIHAIAAGADPGAQALNVSNRFTDDLTGRLRGLLRRRRPRGEASQSPD